jgi:hypothetical protein
LTHTKMTFVDAPPLVAIVAAESQQERIVYITTSDSDS